ncbi:HD domain-containing protein [Candidatus Tisiphia endosymbiont of Ceraclea dissimilis]|uniref:HD domain-containing protein n=1 Tax=Candidatus Tisiphia endosymbiont of Ceraclea dissimilis TaxID=3077928 RepID=UPI003CCAF769
MKCCYRERLINKLLILNERAKDKVDIALVKKAIFFAKKYHGDQKRQSGEPYYSHPIEVAYMVADYLFRTDIIVTAILHDTIEDTDLTKEMIAEKFGINVANQVQDLTRIKGKGIKISSAETVELLYKEKKYDVLLVKLFDRLHNMQTIGAKSPEKIKKIVMETLNYFIILAPYLGVSGIEKQFYKLCWRVLNQNQFVDKTLITINGKHISYTSRLSNLLYNDIQSIFIV